MHWSSFGRWFSGTSPDEVSPEDERELVPVAEDVVRVEPLDELEVDELEVLLDEGDVEVDVFDELEEGDLELVVLVDEGDEVDDPLCELPLE